MLHQGQPLLVERPHPRQPGRQLRVLTDQIIETLQHRRQLGHRPIMDVEILRAGGQHEAALTRLGVNEEAEHVLARQADLLAVIDGVVIDRRPLDHDEGGGVHRQQQHDGQRQQGDDGATEGRCAQEDAKGAQGRPDTFHGTQLIDPTP
jgi:hypothetical protein